MTAIAFIGVAAPHDAPDEALARRLLAAASGLGSGAPTVHVGRSAAAGIALGASRHEWETVGEVVATPALAHRDGVFVVADATLYHVTDLDRRLARPVARADHASHLLEAYHTLGDGVLDVLEGDFAFVLWDERRTRLLAARDFGGKRGLFFATTPGTLRVASTIPALLADGQVAPTLDLASVAAVAAGLWCHGPQTAYRDIREVPAGHVLRWSPGEASRLDAYWSPPTDIAQRRAPLDDAADELRELLAAAVRERMAPSGATAISLSGGWDSTAVYGTAQAVARRPGEPVRSIHAVSISYPEGDPGREDELIHQVTAHWRATPDLIDIASIPLFDDAAAEAARREQPFAHTYERWNRALSRRARAAGARVILDGVGGDQLFQVSDIYLADLFRTGRWLELAKQARIRSGGHVTAVGLWRWAVRPVLPTPVLRAMATLRRMPMAPHYLDRLPPFWFRADALERLGVMERERVSRPSLPTQSMVLAESHAYLRFAFYPRIFNLLHRFAMEEGVELRSPLLDERVVRFAVRRPWSDRADGAETKRLLRRAMRDLLPAEVLAPRPRRTGITSAYFLRELRRRGPAAMAHVLREPRLAAVGVLDTDRLRRAWEHVLRQDDDETAARIFFTMQAELWLRSHEG